MTLDRKADVLIACLLAASAACFVAGRIVSVGYRQMFNRRLDES